MHTLSGKYKASYATIVAALLLVFTADALADKRIMKWTDKNGVVHYGDVIPAQASGRQNKK